MVRFESFLKLFFHHYQDYWKNIEAKNQFHNFFQVPNMAARRRIYIRCAIGRRGTELSLLMELKTFGIFRTINMSHLRRLFPRLALFWRAVYSLLVVKQPFAKKDPTTLHEVFVQAGIEAAIERSEEISRRMKSGEIRFPKGIFRFKTVEEADKWENKILAGKQP